MENKEELYRYFVRKYFEAIDLKIRNEGYKLNDVDPLFWYKFCFCDDNSKTNKKNDILCNLKKIKNFLEMNKISNTYKFQELNFIEIKKNKYYIMEIIFKNEITKKLINYPMNYFETHCDIRTYGKQIELKNIIKNLELFRIRHNEKKLLKYFDKFENWTNSINTKKIIKQVDNKELDLNEKDNLIKNLNKFIKNIN